MKRSKKTAIFVVIFILAFASYVLYLYQQRDAIRDWGWPPGISVTLVDNDENDYVDLKYVKRGTGFYGEDYLPLYGRNIEVRPMENLEKYFIKELPRVILLLGENIKVFFDANVVERERFYRVIIPNFGVEIDNVEAV